jgi:NADP-dependent 3-hydroxy acid dehydrogenase YdfG
MKRPSMPKKHDLVWLVTSYSSGFGHHIATRLLDLSQKVLVTVRKIDQVKSLADRGD